MKTFLGTWIVLFVSATAFAQAPDEVLARVRYTYIQSSNSSTKDKPRSENMLLFIGKNASLYTSYDKLNYEIGQDQKRKTQVMMQAGNSSAPRVIKIDNSGSDWMSKTDYFLFVKENKMLVKELFFYRAYLMDEAIPVISWKISKDTLSFSGLLCKKATANFEGQNWIAWYAPSLPFQSGPWKLNGLPGLIIEAYEESKTIQFQLAGFENVKEDRIKGKSNNQEGVISSLDVAMGTDVASAYFNHLITLPTYRTVKTTRSELDKLKLAQRKDPKGFSKAQLLGQ